MVVKIEPRHRIVRFRLSWFFFNRKNSPLPVKVDYPVPLGVLHVIPEYRCSLGGVGRPLQALRQGVAVKDVVSQNQGHRFSADKLFPQNKRLGNSGRLGLFNITEIKAKLVSVAEELFKTRQVLGG